MPPLFSLIQRQALNTTVWQRRLMGTGWSSTWREILLRCWATWAKRSWSSTWRLWPPWVQPSANSWASTTCTPWSQEWSSCFRWIQNIFCPLHVSCLEVYVNKKFPLCDCFRKRSLSYFITTVFLLWLCCLPLCCPTSSCWSYCWLYPKPSVVQQ